MISKNEKGEYVGIVYTYTKREGPEAGKVYVGCTLDEAERRRKWNNPNTTRYGGLKIDKARKKYKPSEFDYAVKETYKDTDREKLKKLVEAREEHYIVLYDSRENGFNTSVGGASRYARTPEQIAKMVATRKAKGNYSHSEDTKKKISKANTGRKQSPETREKIRQGNLGKKRTPEQRRAMSERQKGKTMSPEARAKSSATKKGKPHPISAKGLANIAAAKYKIPIEVTDKNGNTEVFESMKAAAEATGLMVGSVSNFLKTGNQSKNGYRFAYKDGIKKLPKSKTL